MFLTQDQLVLLEHFINGCSIEPDNIVPVGQSIATRHTAQDTSLWEREGDYDLYMYENMVQ